MTAFSPLLLVLLALAGSWGFFYLVDVPGMRWLNKPWNKRIQIAEEADDPRWELAEAALRRAQLTGDHLLRDLKARGEWPERWHVILKPRNDEGRTTFLQHCVFLPAAIETPDFDGLMGVAHEAVHVQQGEQFSAYVYAFEVSLYLSTMGLFGMFVAWIMHQHVLAAILSIVGIMAGAYHIQSTINLEAEATFGQSMVLRQWIRHTPLTPEEQDQLIMAVEARTAAEMRWYPGHRFARQYAVIWGILLAMILLIYIAGSLKI